MELRGSCVATFVQDSKVRFGPKVPASIRRCNACFSNPTTQKTDGPQSAPFRTFVRVATNIRSPASSKIVCIASLAPLEGAFPYGL